MLIGANIRITVNKWECAYNRYHMHSSKYWLAADETSERVQHLCSFQTQVLAEMNRCANTERLRDKLHGPPQQVAKQIEQWMQHRQHYLQHRRLNAQADLHAYFEANLDATSTSIRDYWEECENTVAATNTATDCDH